MSALFQAIPGKGKSERDKVYLCDADGAHCGIGEIFGNGAMPPSPYRRSADRSDILFDGNEPIFPVTDPEKMETFF